MLFEYLILAFFAVPALTQLLWLAFLIGAGTLWPQSTKGKIWWIAALSAAPIAWPLAFSLVPKPSWKGGGRGNWQQFLWYAEPQLLLIPILLVTGWQISRAVASEAHQPPPLYCRSLVL